MLTKIIGELIERDLGKLKEEIEMFRNEADLWKTEGEITNSAGTLCLHLAGNLRHFFGAVQGGTGYVRDRDAEFSARGISKADLLAGIEAASADVARTITMLEDEDLERNYPIEVYGHPMTTAFFLTHLTTHLGYHLGQINYHRRLLSDR